MKRLSVLCGALLLSGSLLAQSPNDAGVPVQGGGLNLLNGQPAVLGAICPTGVTTATFSGANTQLGRIFRDGIAGACPSKVYPGIFNAATTYNYEAFTYTNTSGVAACVTVNFDPNAGTTPCATNAHASAYLGSYDPNNQATNFLGDVGSSITQPFSFEVAAGNDMVLVVSNTSSQAVCDFTFEVLNLPCSVGPVLTTNPVSGSTITLPPHTVGGLPSTALVDFINPGPGAATVTCMAPALPEFTVAPLSIPVAASTTASATISFSSGAVGSFNSVLNCSAGAQNFTFNLAATANAPARPVPANDPRGMLLLAALALLIGGVVYVRSRG